MAAMQGRILKTNVCHSRTHTLARGSLSPLSCVPYKTHKSLILHCGRRPQRIADHLDRYIFGRIAQSIKLRHFQN